MSEASSLAGVLVDALAGAVLVTLIASGVMLTRFKATRRQGEGR